MPIILMVASAIKDCGPSLIRQLGRVREQPVKINVGGSHARVGHEEDPTGIFEEPTLLGRGEGGLSTKDGSINAGSDGVQKEEIESAFVRWTLCSRGKIDLSL